MEDTCQYMLASVLGCFGQNGIVDYDSANKACYLLNCFNIEEMLKNRECSSSFDQKFCSDLRKSDFGSNTKDLSSKKMVSALLNILVSINRDLFLK